MLPTLAAADVRCQVEFLTLEPRHLSFLLEALLIAEGDDSPVARDRTKMLGMHVRGISLEVAIVCASLCVAQRILSQTADVSRLNAFCLLQVRLRVACIELLCSAMGLESMKMPQNFELRNRMIACFFKSLTVRWEEVSLPPPPPNHLPIHIQPWICCRLLLWRVRHSPT